MLLGLTLGLYALQSVLLGLRWGGFPLPVVNLGMLAICIPPLTWLALKQLTTTLSPRLLGGAFLAILAALSSLYVITLFRLFFWGDIIAIAIYIGFGALLIVTARTSKLQWAQTLPFHWVVPCRQAHLIAGAALVVSGLVDLLVTVDFAYYNGQHAGQIVGIANLCFLIAVLALYIFYSNIFPQKEVVVATASPARPSREAKEMEAIVTALDHLMEDEAAYCDENLTVALLAKRTGVSARQLSEAVNSARAMNVPQYVNCFRIKEACQRLSSTSEPVTQIMFDVGFTTKSNFNREFVRITGMSPSAWRQQTRAKKGAVS